MDGWINWWINGWMDVWMDRSNDLWIDGSMDCPPPPLPHYLPPSEGYRQRGLSLLRIRTGCPTGILVFFGMEEFVREGGRRQPSRADSEQRPHVNVDVNVDLCSALSCELVGILSNLKRWKLSTAHMPGRWRGGRWSEKCQLGRCTSQRWGAQARTHKQDVLAQWFFDITDFFPDTTVFTIRKLALRTSEIKKIDTY